MDITKIQSAGYNITYIAQPGETGPRVLVDLRTPFNDAATAAIKASFTGAQWETIRAWGATADAYLIAAVNQFAVEDPRIMCSLVSGLGIRRTLPADGSIYFDSGLCPHKDFVTQYQGYILGANGSGATHMAGTASNQYVYGFYNGGSATWDNYGDDVSLAPYYGGSWMPSAWYTVLKNKNVLSINGEVIRTATYADLGATQTMGILCCHWRGEYVRIAISGNKYLRLDVEDNGTNHIFVPFELGTARAASEVYPSSKGAQAAGTIGLMDLATGLFHANLGTGTPTTVEEEV